MMSPTDLIWIIGTLVATPVFDSIAEWSLHKFIMHNTWLQRRPWPLSLPPQRHGDHHIEICTGRPAHNRSWAWLMVFFFLGVGWGLARYVNLYGGIIFASISCVYTLLFEVFHAEMHDQLKWWWLQPMKQTKWFCSLRAHHMVHHFERPKTNYNVVLPLGDLLFGTLHFGED